MEMTCPMYGRNGGKQIFPTYFPEHCQKKKKKKKKKNSSPGKIPSSRKRVLYSNGGRKSGGRFLLVRKKKFFLNFFYAKTRVVPKQRMLVVTCHDLLDVRCTFFFVNFFPEIGAKWRHSKKTRPKMTKTRKHTYFGHTLSSLNDEKLLVFFLKQTGTNSNLITRQKNRQFLLF